MRPCEEPQAGDLTLEAGTGRVSSRGKDTLTVLHWRPPGRAPGDPCVPDPVRWAAGAGVVLPRQARLRPPASSELSTRFERLRPCLPGFSPFAPTQAVFADPASPFRLRIANARYWCLPASGLVLALLQLCAWSTHLVEVPQRA